MNEDVFPIAMLIFGSGTYPLENQCLEDDSVPFLKQKADFQGQTVSFRHGSIYTILTLSQNMERRKDKVRDPNS